MLVSEQAAPNLLPALDPAMKPKEAVLLVSQKMAHRAQALPQQRRAVAPLRAPAVWPGRGHAAAHLGAGDAIVAVGPHADALAAAARRAGFAGDAVHAPAFSDAFALEAAALAPQGAAILLKGSRGARMERFVEPLRSAFGSAAPGESAGVPAAR
jgi:hypothetical protein